MLFPAFYRSIFAFRRNVEMSVVLKEYVKKKDTVSMILIVIIIRAVSIIDAKI